jgi:hypothetical protein
VGIPASRTRQTIRHHEASCCPSLTLSCPARCRPGMILDRPCRATDVVTGLAALAGLSVAARRAAVQYCLLSPGWVQMLSPGCSESNTDISKIGHTVFNLQAPNSTHQSLRPLRLRSSSLTSTRSQRHPIALADRLSTGLASPVMSSVAHRLEPAGCTQSGLGARRVTF